MPIRNEVPPAWRFNWAAARPPLFMSASLLRIAYADAAMCPAAISAELEPGRL